MFALTTPPRSQPHVQIVSERAWVKDHRAHSAPAAHANTAPRLEGDVQRKAQAPAVSTLDDKSRCVQAMRSTKRMGLFTSLLGFDPALTLPMLEAYVAEQQQGGGGVGGGGEADAGGAAS